MRSTTRRTISANDNHAGDSTVRVWDTASGKTVRLWEARGRPVACVAFDRSGTHPDLYYDVLQTEGCDITGRRSLVRRPVTVEPAR